MKVKLNAALCTGHGRCYGLAPEVFDADDMGHCVIPEEQVPEGLQAKAKTAVANCPEGALFIEDA